MCTLNKKKYELTLLWNLSTYSTVGNIFVENQHASHYSILTITFHIYEGNNGASETLNWRTRVRVMVEAAQGILQQKRQANLDLSFVFVFLYICTMNIFKLL